MKEKVSEEFQLFQEWYLLMSKVEQRLNVVTSRYGINFNQYIILKMVDGSGYDEPSLLAGKFELSRPAISRKLNVLYKKKKIMKIHNDMHDQRKVRISLTSEGKEDLARTEIAYQIWLSKMVSEENIDVRMLANQTKFLADSIPKL